ncbi:MULTISPECIES: hypothetical protein [Bacillaceae]|uniref:hypothetical protein n=1 Tax=Bacillaceae TaxID=186817 RepID=UPI00037A535B|nr:MULTISPECIES: hypothetical protein [Bacillaceae]
MPRQRKYDYQKDYPVKIFLKVPVGLLNKLEDDMGYDRQKLSELVERLLTEYVENNR